MLLFKARFLDLIRTGRKVQTVRCWRRRPPAVGSVQRVHRLGALRITGVDHITPADLTDEDARADGFGSLAELHGAIRECYGAGPPPAGARWYRIRFAFLGADERPAHP